MKKRKSSNISTHKEPDSLGALKGSISRLETVFQKARQHDFRVSTHSFYRQKALTELANLRRWLLVLANEYAEGKIAQQLDALQVLADGIDIDSDVLSMIALL